MDVEDKFRDAILLVYNHMHRIKTANRQELLAALELMKHTVERQDMVLCYQP